jgi:hypothetical protein
MLNTGNKALAVSDLPDFVKSIPWGSDLMKVKQKYGELKYDKIVNCSLGKVIFYKTTQQVNIFDKIEEREISYGFLKGKLVCIQTELADSNYATFNEFSQKNGPPDKLSKDFINKAQWDRGETVINWWSLKMNIPFVNVGDVQKVILSYNLKEYHDLITKPMK